MERSARFRDSRSPRLLVVVVAVGAVCHAGCDDGRPFLTGDTGGDETADAPADHAIVTDDAAHADDTADTDDAPEVCIPVAEDCNRRDDDCDGLVDEDFDLVSDTDNCGACGVSCRDLPNAEGLCQDGACVIAVCDYPWWDVDQWPENGCEYRCTSTSTSEYYDTCFDSTDNDCDGRTDCEDVDCECGCLPEVCDRMDNDCDELTDEDFDVDFDPLNCGECGHVCPTSVGFETLCILGECDLLCAGPPPACGDCPPWPHEETETECNGMDDDCDGMTDEDFVPETTCGLGFCERHAICHRGEVLPCVPREPLREDDPYCDGVDEDCDGETDDEFRGVACGTGVCASASVCADGSERPCVPSPPLSDVDTTCDGIDDDCDGATDEEC